MSKFDIDDIIPHIPQPNWNIPESPENIPTPKVEVPDRIGTVQGFRGWQWDYQRYFQGCGHLRSMTRHTIWTPGQVTRAVCGGNADPNMNGDVAVGFTHQSPNEKCKCGIYMLNSLEDVIDYFGFNVYGKVAGWGKVVEAENGFRVEYCYPLEFFIIYKEAKNLHQFIDKLKNWNVPVKFVKRTTIYTGTDVNGNLAV